jgi:hypothetical protein
MLPAGHTDHHVRNAWNALHLSVTALGTAIAPADALEWLNAIDDAVTACEGTLDLLDPPAMRTGPGGAATPPPRAAR